MTLQEVGSPLTSDHASSDDPYWNKQMAAKPDRSNSLVQMLKGPDDEFSYARQSIVSRDEDDDDDTKTVGLDEDANNEEQKEKRVFMRTWSNFATRVNMLVEDTAAPINLNQANVVAGPVSFSTLNDDSGPATIPLSVDTVQIVS